MSDAAADVHAAARLQAFLETPYLCWLGVRGGLADGKVTLILPAAPRIVGNSDLGALHGGAVGAFLQAAAQAQLTVFEPGGPAQRALDLNIDYLRPGRLAATFAAAELRKAGRRVCNVHAIAWQETPDTPIATLHGHFVALE